MNIVVKLTEEEQDMLTAVAVVAIGVALVGALWYTGRKAEKSFDQTAQEFGELKLVASR